MASLLSMLLGSSVLYRNVIPFKAESYPIFVNLPVCPLTDQWTDVWSFPCLY